MHIGTQGMSSPLAPSPEGHPWPAQYTISLISERGSEERSLLMVEEKKNSRKKESESDIAWQMRFTPLPATER